MKEFDVEKFVNSLTKEELQQDVKNAFRSMQKQGMPIEILKKILTVAEPIGDFEALRDRYELTDEEFEALFSGIPRREGLNRKAVPDGYAYGASGFAAMLGYSPHMDADPEHTCKSMRGEADEKEPDPVRDMIFFSGHAAEPMYRKFFARLYKDRYIVIECDIQWHSKIWKHFLGNVDGFLIDLETGELGILEIKHTDYNNHGGVREGFTNSKGLYPTVEESFWGNKSTRCYGMQGDGYMQMFHGIAKFVCYFLGWGARCTFDATAMVRIDLDEDRGMAMLDEAENFVEDYVIPGIIPDYRMIKETSHYAQVVREVFKEVDPTKDCIKLPPEMKTQAESLDKIKEELDKKHEEVKALQKEEEALTKIYEEHQVPFIEALGDNPKGYIELDDKRIYITFNVPNGLDEEKLRREYPAEAAACETRKVSATKLKKEYGKAYNECYGPKLDAPRKFSMKTYKKK